MGAIIFGRSTQHIDRCGIPIQTRVVSLPPPVVSGGGTSLFPLFFYLRIRFGTSLFFKSRYLTVVIRHGCPTTNAFGWLTQGSFFNWSLSDSLAATNILFFSLFFPLSLSPEISILFFFQFSISRSITLHFILTQTRNLLESSSALKV